MLRLYVEKNVLYIIGLDLTFLNGDGFEQRFGGETRIDAAV